MPSAENNSSYPEFTSDFVWGAYFSAHGLEGENYHTDWWHWEQRPGRISDQSTSDPAARHGARYAQDYHLAARFGMKTVLVALSWARIQPAPDRIDSTALTGYAKQLQAIRAEGMQPWVVLLEYALPDWVARQGGWASPEFPALYRSYLIRVLGALQGHCHHWIPLLNPGHLAKLVFQAQLGPGGQGSGIRRKRLYTHTLDNLKQAACMAYALIKEMQPEAQVGASFRLEACVPHEPYSPWDFRACQRARAQAMLPYTPSSTEADALPMDFVLAAFYGRQRIRFSLCSWPFTAQHCDLTGQLTTPDNVYSDAEAIKGLLPYWAAYGKPIYVMSGLATDSDVAREAYLHDLWYLLGAYRAQGVAIEGFIHHTLLDSFEWRLGYSARYGLIYLDSNTQARTPNPSALLQQTVAEKGILPPRPRDKGIS